MKQMQKYIYIDMYIYIGTHMQWIFPKKRYIWMFNILIAFANIPISDIIAGIMFPMLLHYHFNERCYTTTTKKNKYSVFYGVFIWGNSCCCLVTSKNIYSNSIMLIFLTYHLHSSNVVKTNAKGK